MGVQLLVSLLALLVGLISSMILSLVVWPAVAWSEGRINSIVVLAVALAAALWVSMVALSVGVIEKVLLRHRQRHFAVVVAACTVVGLVGGWVVRRIAFGRPWESDYPLEAYALLYTVGLVGALVGVWGMRRLATQGP